MARQQFTIFWKKLGIVVPKRVRTEKDYNHKPDIAALCRLGIDRSVVQNVYEVSLGFSDTLFFRNFSRFFRKDVNTVKVWANNTRSITKAFLHLFNTYRNNNLNDASIKFLELALIFEFYKKGEGQILEGKCRPGISINSFSTRSLRQILTRKNRDSQYIDKGVVQFGKERIFWIQKNAGNKVTNKFIKISKTGSVLRVSISMDSKLEYYLTRNDLEKRFDTYLDSSEFSKNFKKFTEFLKSGKSDHFTLSGATYLESDFRISMVPSFNRVANAALVSIYKKKLSGTLKKLEAIKQFRVSHNDGLIVKPVFISILTYKEGIFGAILLKPDDKGLTKNQRKALYDDFRKDFGLPLNCFLKYDDLDDHAIYKLFLSTEQGKNLKIELRSAKAMSIYKSLVTDNLIASNKENDEDSHVCINKSCANYFKRIWGTRKYCRKCGDVLIEGRGVEIKRIDEKNVSKFLKDSLIDFHVSNASRKLLSRNIFVTQVTHENQMVDLIPITKPLDDNQLEVLKFRYPHAIIVTAKEDKHILMEKKFQVLDLWELVLSIKTANAVLLKTTIKKCMRTSLNRMRDLYGDSIERVGNDNYYKERNKEVKNLGAELFEADCSVLFDYVFGNCLWLGAKYRGVSLPDGFTAFPMLDSNKGCFIWDGKFSEGKALVMGKFSKNKTYIKDGKTNRSIVANGGLKGFVFISNNVFPVSFLEKYKKLNKKERIKISFIRDSLFKKIAEHYQLHEKFLLNNSKARKQFVSAMAGLFFTFSGNRKVEIVSDSTVDSIIEKNINYFSSLRAGKKLSA